MSDEITDTERLNWLIRYSEYFKIYHPTNKSDPNSKWAYYPVPVSREAIDTAMSWDNQTWPECENV